MKTIFKDQEQPQVLVSSAVEADRPRVANVGLNMKSQAGSDSDYEGTIEVRIANVLGVAGEDLSVEITCEENSAFDVTIDGTGSTDSPFEQGVLTSSNITASIASGTEQYSFAIKLYEDGTEVQSEELTAVIYYDLSE